LNTNRVAAPRRRSTTRRRCRRCHCMSTRGRGSPPARPKHLLRQFRRGKIPSSPQRSKRLRTPWPRATSLPVCSMLWPVLYSLPVNTISSCPTSDTPTAISSGPAPSRHSGVQAQNWRRVKTTTAACLRQWRPACRLRPLRNHRDHVRCAGNVPEELVLAARQPHLAARDGEQQPQHRHLDLRHDVRGQHRVDPAPQVLADALQRAEPPAVQQRQHRVAVVRHRQHREQSRVRPPRAAAAAAAATAAAEAHPGAWGCSGPAPACPRLPARGSRAVPAAALPVRRDSAAAATASFAELAAAPHTAMMVAALLFVPLPRLGGGNGAGTVSTRYVQPYVPRLPVSSPSGSLPGTRPSQPIWPASIDLKPRSAESSKPDSSDQTVVPSLHSFAAPRSPAPTGCAAFGRVCLARGSRRTPESRTTSSENPRHRSPSQGQTWQMFCQRLDSRPQNLRFCLAFVANRAAHPADSAAGPLYPVRAWTAAPTARPVPNQQPEKSPISSGAKSRLRRARAGSGLRRP